MSMTIHTRSFPLETGHPVSALPCAYASKRNALASADVLALAERRMP